MYGFFPAEEEAVPMLIVPLEESALSFFKVAEEEVALAFFKTAEGETSLTTFAPVEGGASSFFAPVAGVGKKQFSSRTSCCPGWVWGRGSRNDNAPAD